MSGRKAQTPVGQGRTCPRPITRGGLKRRCWDESLNREYDLDRSTSGVDDFTSAQWNKGLNIFNSPYPRREDTATTRRQYAGVLYEYFHNWSGDGSPLVRSA
jgi:hypothetical protein